jgi:D-tyrosyl-tRNA(Tyr) deacylase
MIAVLQRVLEAKVEVAGNTVGQIGPGILAFVAVVQEDTAEDVTWMANKLSTIRMFRSPDSEKHFDLDVTQVNGSILLVSQFTLAAATKKGRRPSFDRAAPPDLGRKLFDDLVHAVKQLKIPTATGQFAADMKVSLINDGPVTFIVDSRQTHSSAAPSTS